MPSFFDFLGDVPGQVGTALSTPKPPEVTTAAKPITTPPSDPSYAKKMDIAGKKTSNKARILKSLFDLKKVIAGVGATKSQRGMGVYVAPQPWQIEAGAAIDDFTQKGGMDQDYRGIIADLAPIAKQVKDPKALKVITDILDYAEEGVQAESLIAAEGPKLEQEAAGVMKPAFETQAAQDRANADKLKAEYDAAGKVGKPKLEAALKAAQDKATQSAERLKTSEAIINPPKQDPPLADAVNAVGVNRGDLSKAYMAFAAPLIAGGFNLGAPIGPSMLGPAIIGITKAMGPEAQAAVLSKLTWKQSLNQYQREKPMGTGKGSEPDPFEARMAQREAEMDAKFQELNNLQVFSNTGDVLLYIVFSLLLGPQPATLLFTNHAKRGTLRDELDLMHQDLDSMYKRASSQQRLQEMARQNAAEEDLNERKFAFDRKYKYDKLYADIAKGRGSGKSPTDIALDKSLRGKMNEYNRLKDQLNNEFAFDLNKAGAKAVRDKIMTVSGEIDEILALIYNSANPDIKQAIDEYNADQGE